MSKESVQSGNTINAPFADFVPPSIALFKDAIDRVNHSGSYAPSEHDPNAVLQYEEIDGEENIFSGDQ